MKSSTIKSSQISKFIRLDGSYHLSEGVQYSEKIHRMKFEYLGDLASNIFTAGRTKRVYTFKEFGYPYLSNSDVSRNNPFDSCNYSSKKYGFDEKSVLKEGMIVTGRVGAIGQTSYITSEFEEKKAMGSDNIIRIVTKNKSISGYVYAFLASKYGETFFNKLSAGGVQPYISEDMIKDIPVPLLSETKQHQIHQLIVEASSLRVKANKLLNEAHEEYRLMFKTSYQKTGFNYKVNIKQNNPFYRLNANFFISEGQKLEQIVIENDHVFLEEITKRIFTSGRDKRDYIKDIKNGKYYFSNSDLGCNNPYKSASILRKNKVKNDSIIKETYLLTGRVGSVGEIFFPFRHITGHIASDNIIRIEFKKLEDLYLAFTFLSSSYGKKIIFKHKSGTNQPFVSEDMISRIPIPVLDKDSKVRVIKKIKNYSDNIEKAFFLENQAIDLIEKEIDAWQ